jgi:glycosyltransferase involved in cell wall biosynthesis
VGALYAWVCGAVGQKWEALLRLSELLKEQLRRIKRYIGRKATVLWQMRVLGQVQKMQTPAWKPGDVPKVSYTHIGFPKPPPGPDSLVHGGAVKYGYLDRRLPHAGLQFNILYAVSSSQYVGLAKLIRVAQGRGAKVVWNQNGAWFPASYGVEVARKGNAAMAPLLHQADYVFYQSEFAQQASDHFLGKRLGPSEILYNAVDTKFLSPSGTPRSSELILLTAGSHNRSYRLPTVIRTLAVVCRQRSRVRMIVAGRMSLSMEAEVCSLVARFGLESRVELVGPYTQRDAPEIFRRAHILLHTHYNDVCPTVVVEAMACGLPVVYSQSGGTPELVGEEAGYGVPAVLNWEEVQPPDPHQLAEGILLVAEDWARCSQAARERAVSHFDLEPWLERHIQVFEMLLLEDEK